MPEERTLADIILRWITDTKSQKAAVKSIQDVEKAAAGAGKTAKALGSEWQIYTDTLGKSEKEVRAVADALNGTGPAAQRASDTLSEWNQQLLRGIDNTESVAKSTQKLSGLLTGVGGFTLIRLGRELDRAGKSILSPIQAFIDAQGETSDVGFRWLEATQKIEQSTQRIGAVMAEQLLPTLEKAAELADKVATLIENNPGLAKAAAFTGIGAIGLGGLVTTIGDLITTIAGLKVLGLLPKAGLAGVAGGEAAAGAGAGATLAGAGTFLSAAALPAASLFGGVKLQNVLREDPENKMANFIDTFSNLFPVLGFGVDAGKELSKALEQLNLWMGKTAKTTEEVAKPSKAAVDAYINFVKANNDAEQKYMQDRQSIIEDGLKKIAQLEASYTTQRANAIEDYDRQRSNAIENFSLQQTFAEAQFELSQQRALEDYYRRRSQMAEDYHASVQRAEEQHQKRIRQLTREHNDRVADLVAARDALGLARERRDYERKRQDEEDNYRTEARARNKDFARKLEEMEQQFRIEQARRAQDFAIRQEQDRQRFALQQEQAAEQFQARLEQMDEQHKIEVEQARAQNREKLNELQQQYNQERVERRYAFLDQLRDLQDTLLHERETRLAYYQAMEADLVAWLASMNGAFGSNQPGYPETHAAGGYGPGYVGRGEFVANRSTTKMLEQMVGGRLTQQNVLGASSQTINLQFPAGLITMKTLRKELDNRFSTFTRQLAGALA